MKEVCVITKGVDFELTCGAVLRNMLRNKPSRRPFWDDETCYRWDSMEDEDFWNLYTEISKYYSDRVYLLAVDCADGARSTCGNLVPFYFHPNIKSHIYMTELRIAEIDGKPVDEPIRWSCDYIS